MVIADTPFVYGEAAGLIAEFCSLGGQITHRASANAAGRQDYSELVAAFPSDGIDGAFMASHWEPLEALLHEHPFFAGNIADRAIGGFLTFTSDTTLYSEFAEQLDGVVFAEPAHDPNPVGDAYERYFALMSEAFPTLAGGAPFNPTTSHYTAMEAVLRALEAVGGDLSGQARFRQALSALEFESPVGRVKLDANRHAIGRAVASRFVIDEDGALVPVNFHRIDDVEQTYNGYFTPNSPEPGLAGPECVAGDPPPWALGE